MSVRTFELFLLGYVAVCRRGEQQVLCKSWKNAFTGFQFLCCKPCRSLIIRSSSSKFLGLAPSSLQSLDFERGKPSGLQASTIFQLTGLTRLQLTEVPDSSPFLRLQSSALQELAFIHCTGIEFLAGADLRNLRRLHIDGDRTDLASSVYVRVGSIVQSAPQLEQVSGYCRLYSIGMEDTTRTWKRTRITGWQITGSHRYAQGERYPVWKKPK